MNTDWQSFLDSISISETHDETQAVIYPITDRTLVKVSGSDAQTFLQNQLSNDINHVDQQHSQLSSYSSAKGMMFANFRVFFINETYYLSVPTEIVEPVTKRLRMFVLRDDVKIELDNTLVSFGVLVPKSSELPQIDNISFPNKTDLVSQTRKATVVNVNSPTNARRYEVIATTEMAVELWQTLANAGFAAANNGKALQLLSGEAFITQATYEQFVAQMLNLDLINGVNFKKGCYPGQEYIARTQYRGKIRSRLHLLRIESAEPIDAGSKIFVPNKLDDEAVGTVIESTHHQDSQLALAVVRLKQAEKGELVLESNDPTQITVLELPYAFPSE